MRCHYAPVSPTWSCSSSSMGLFLLVEDIYVLGCFPVCLLSSPHVAPIGDLQTSGPWPILTPCSTGHRPLRGPPRPPTMKGVTCRATICQAPQGAPPHA